MAAKTNWERGGNSDRFTCKYGNRTVGFVSYSGGGHWIWKLLTPQGTPKFGDETNADQAKSACDAAARAYLEGSSHAD